LAEDEGFLQRWARRKAEHGTPADDGAAPTSPTKADADSAPAELTHAPESGQAIDLDALPDIDSLDAGSDFSVFMQDGVPDALRTRALQKLWRLDPAFGHIDGLLEYGENFTDSNVAVGAVRTIYEVSKGMLGGNAEEAATPDPAPDAQPSDTAASDGMIPVPDLRTDTAPDTTTDSQTETRIAVRPDDPDRPG
jgi:Protein of unknown function (DUF3306)